MDDQRSETCVLWDKVKKDFFNCKDSRVLAGYGTNTFGIELKPRCLGGIGGRDGKWAAGSEDRSIEFRLEVGQRGQLQNHGNFPEFIGSIGNRRLTKWKSSFPGVSRAPSSTRLLQVPTEARTRDNGTSRESHLRNSRFELRISSGTIPLLKPSSGRRLFQAHWFRLPTPSPLRSGGRGISLLFDS